MRVAIIGGGAAGFFAAINVKENYPNSKVTIFEKSGKFLSKIRISGGGRCNVTNGCKTIDELCNGYPRGARQIKKHFFTFNNHHTIKWFTDRGVPIYIQDDNRAFPKSNNSESIIECFMGEVRRLKIDLQTGVKVKAISHNNENKIQLSTNIDTKKLEFDKVIVTTGGSPTIDGLMWLRKLNHEIEKPVPSLFTFKIPNDKIISLMGLSVENVAISIQNTKLKSTGPLLITHWGMSGPAVLKLSAFGARILSDLNYSFKINLNWLNNTNIEQISKFLTYEFEKHPHKLIYNFKIFQIPNRLWAFLLNKIEIPENRTASEIGKKNLNRLINILTNDEYTIKGRTTYRDEFVTCGGVSLKSIDMNTMQSKVFKNMYFAGEIIDVDGITGGYNFQNAWTTAFIAAKLL